MALPALRSSRGRGRRRGGSRPHASRGRWRCRGLRGGPSRPWWRCRGLRLRRGGPVPRPRPRGPMRSPQTTTTPPASRRVSASGVATLSAFAPSAAASSARKWAAGRGRSGRSPRRRRRGRWGARWRRRAWRRCGGSPCGCGGRGSARRAGGRCRRRGRRRRRRCRATFAARLGWLRRISVLAAGPAGGAGVDVGGAERLAQQALDQVALLVGGVAEDRRAGAAGRRSPSAAASIARSQLAAPPLSRGPSIRFSSANISKP